MSEQRKRLQDIIGKLAGSGYDGIDDALKAIASTIKRCKACGQKNRISPGKKGTPRCGKCGLPL